MFRFHTLRVALIVTLSFSSSVFAEDSSPDPMDPGLQALYAASGVAASIALCEKNLWTKADENELVHDAARLLNAPDDAAAQALVDVNLPKLLSEIKAKGKLETFCSAMVDAKLKVMGGQSL